MSSVLLKSLHHTYQSHHSNRFNLVQIIDEMVKNDLLDLIGRVMFLLKPTLEAPSHDYGKLSGYCPTICEGLTMVKLGRLILGEPLTRCSVS
jgi:hypothetical protein